MLSPLLQEYMGAESSSTRVSDTSVREQLFARNRGMGRSGG